MARTACVTTVVLAAGIAAGVATGEQGTKNPGLPRLEQPGVGAFMVGMSTGLLALSAMRVAYVLHRRRRKPDATYSTRYGTGLTAGQYLRQVTFVALCCAAMCCLGLWLRHQYG
jgi:hypothetical protein